jgi:predicted aspartyl protease
MKPLKLIPVALDEKSYHVFLTFYVDGVKCRFLLDTGASKTVIDKAFAEKTDG